MVSKVDYLQTIQSKVLQIRLLKAYSGQVKYYAPPKA